ncbi:MAG: Hpt domain-containing protein [Pseudomonadaceae bacterium]|nr:Hpt domain-containing protein [Pseudomonadaceae bacterium]
MTTHLDETLICELRELMEDDFTVLLDAYLAEAPIQRAAIETAFEESDPEALRRTAHSLKGSSANIGATQLAQICHKIEESAHGADADQLAMLLSGLASEFDVVGEEIRGLYPA